MIRNTRRTLVEWRRVCPVDPGILEDFQPSSVRDDSREPSALEKGHVEGHVEQRVQPRVDVYPADAAALAGLPAARGDKNTQKLVGPFESVCVEICVELFATLCPPTICMLDAVEVGSGDGAEVERALNVIGATEDMCGGNASVLC
jgi:hypothetical protein